MREGKFNDAVKAAETAVASARQLGPGTGLDLADSLTALGLALAAFGDAERSLAPFSEALELREQTLSASHPTAATARNNVAFALHRTGRYRRAVDEERKVYRDRVASVGRHAPATWQALVNLATAEADAEGRSTAATTLGRSPYELGTSIETGARDVEPDSADFWPIKPARPMLPTLTLYAAVTAPLVEYDWPERRSDFAPRRPDRLRAGAGTGPPARPAGWVLGLQAEPAREGDAGTHAPAGRSSAPETEG